MSSEEFEQFRHLVLADRSLQKELRSITDKEIFIRRVLELGSENGFDFDRNTVEEAMRGRGRTLGGS